MTGTVHYSLEQAEFTADGKTYFINGGDSLMDQVEKNRLSSGSYNVTLNNVCIQGKVLTKRTKPRQRIRSFEQVQSGG